MRKIKNSKQLEEAISSLKAEVVMRENNLKESFSNTKEAFKPTNLLLKFVSDVSGVNFVKGDFLASGIMATISIIVHRLLTKQESVLEQKITGWAETIVNKLKDLRTKKQE